MIFGVSLYANLGDTNDALQKIIKEAGASDVNLSQVGQEHFGS